MSFVVSKRKLVLFIVATIIMSSRIFGVNINQYIRYGIAAVYTLYFGILCLKNGRINAVINKHLKLAYTPWIVFVAYTLIVWQFSEDISLRNYTGITSTVIYLLLAIGFAASAFYLLGVDIVDILFWAGVTSYLVGSIFYGCVEVGFSGIIEYIKALLGFSNVSGRIGYIMEVHELTFTMGLFFLYYTFFASELDASRKKKSVISLLLIFLGLKRIEILALLISIIIYFVLLKGGRTIAFRSSVVTIGSCFASFLFLFFIKVGFLDIFALENGIETSGRLAAYNFAKNYFELDLFYPGKGYTWFMKRYLDLYNTAFRIDGHRIAASVHSDVLTLYIELGFIVFFAWLVYIMLIKTIRMAHTGNIRVAEFYLMATIFMFICYLTDNTINYFSTQMIYFLLPLVMEWRLLEDNLE